MGCCICFEENLWYPERMEYRYHAIGIVHSCFKENFGIPRQAGLVPDACGILELFDPFNRREYLEGLEGFSHIWLQYVLHAASMGSKKSKVRPPRLGGNRRMGVFGTRSNFRPNPIGLSAVVLEDIVYGAHGAQLRLKGIDILDQTPVLDIKPYLPYADCLADAGAGFARIRPKATLSVRFDARVRTVLRELPHPARRQLARLLIQVLRLDPRPAYFNRSSQRRVFGMHLMDWNVRWRLEGGMVVVAALEPFVEERLSNKDSA
jgi:tRNA-Thr(GGU) m(6)t(6)A37 methyltransferase TsaA